MEAVFKITSQKKQSSFGIRHCAVLFPISVYLVLLFFVLQLSVPLKSRKDVDTKYVEPDITIEYKELSRAVPPLQLLTIVFKKVDIDGNQLLSITELTEYIHRRTKEHISQALSENYGLFMAIDKNPRNGVITWQEYHEYFLQKHGVDEEYIKKHSERHSGLGRTLKELIARDKASWSEAAKTDPESLTLDEFLAFRHPESSHSNILASVEDLLEKLDRDGDELLTEEEFAIVQMGEDGSRVVNGGEESERRREFRENLDTDSNGKADRHELLRYLEPGNPRHAKEEATTLFTLADVDHDGYLSLTEVLTKMDLFLGSKMVDTARSFHDEF